MGRHLGGGDLRPAFSEFSSEVDATERQADRVRAQTEWMRTRGIIYGGGEFTFPRVHVECDFNLALRHDDLIAIEVFLTKLGRSSARLEFLTRKDGEVAATGAVVIVCMSRATQRAIPIPDELRAKLQDAVTA